VEAKYLNSFIVRLKCDITEDIKRHLEKRSTIITHFDKIMPDTIIVETELSREEFNKLQYVAEAKEPRIGGFNDQYMTI
jgi:hypothetical protein